MEKATGLDRIIKACGYSLAGIKAAWSEAAFRQEIIVAIVAIPAALNFSDTGVERAVLIFSVFLVLIVEMINSAIEVVVDRISTEKHSLSKIAKDMGSAAVALSLLNAGVVWLLVLTS